MAYYNPNIHHRRSIRLKGYNYSQAGIYFITLCTQDRLHLFGEIIEGKMELNPFGEIAAEEWEKSIDIRKNISLGEYIIMPNHIHGIIQIDWSNINKEKAKNNQGKFISPSQTIGAIIRGYKGATTKRIKILISKSKDRDSENFQLKNPDTGVLQYAPAGIAPAAFPPSGLIKKIDLSKSIWQRNYYENIIRNQRAYQNISNYIINNPKKWEEDKFHL